MVEAVQPPQGETALFKQYWQQWQLLNAYDDEYIRCTFAHAKQHSHDFEELRENLKWEYIVHSDSARLQRKRGAFMQQSKMR